MGIGMGSRMEKGTGIKRKSPHFDIMGRYKQGSRLGVRPKVQHICNYVYKKPSNVNVRCQGIFYYSKTGFCRKHAHEFNKQKRNRKNKVCEKCGQTKRLNKFWKNDPKCRYCRFKGCIRKRVDVSLKYKSWIRCYGTDGVVWCLLCGSQQISMITHDTLKYLSVKYNVFVII